MAKVTRRAISTGREPRRGGLPLDPGSPPPPYSDPVVAWLEFLAVQLAREFVREHEVR